MSRIKARKIIKTINKGISLNPTTITFTQTKRTIVDGAFQEEEIERSIDVLIYLEDSSNKVIIDSKPQGTSYKSNRYKMIADKDADLEINPQNAIEFKCLEGKMRIKAVYPIVIENIICGYECDLERVD